MEKDSSQDRHADAAQGQVSKATSELNNLLQIIAGTSDAIENIWEGNDASEKYLAMLRESIERAEKVTAELAQSAGGADKKALLNPDLAGFAKVKKSSRPTNGSASEIPPQSILVVDDEQMVLTLVKRLLSEAGFNVITAQSGFECLDTFRRAPQSFALVVVDLTMPFMDGEETFTRLRELRQDVPVLLCTGFIAHEKLERMMNAGLSGFLRKPIAPDEIVSHVRSILNGVRFRGVGSTSGVSVVV